MPTLPSLSLAKLTATQADSNAASYAIEPLSPGYGVTLGNSLRRVLIASIEGAAIVALKINNVTHEFTTIEGASEDVVSIILNLKEIRIKSQSDEPVILKLEARGAKTVTAADFAKNPLVEIANPEHVITILEKGASLSIEAIVKRGRGYVPVEAENRQTDQLPKGYIAIDAVYTPVRKVHFEVENTRVGETTNFDKLTLNVSTDGTITPHLALAQAAGILAEHFSLISDSLPQDEITSKPKKVVKKTAKAKK